MKQQPANRAALTQDRRLRRLLLLAATLCVRVEVKVIFGKLDKNQDGAWCTHAIGGEERRRRQRASERETESMQASQPASRRFCDRRRVSDWFCCIAPSRLLVSLCSSGLIDVREWVSVLFDLFRFMSAAAFDKHCQASTRMHACMHTHTPTPGISDPALHCAAPHCAALPELA